jgi:uroporphyrinogen decarboxylase
MTSRERLLNTISGQLPDRPPVFATVTPQVAQKMSNALDLAYEEPLDSLTSTRISHRNLLIHLGNDCVGIAACAPIDKPTITDMNGITINEWGMRFKNIGLYSEFESFPLASIETAHDVETYDFPDPHASGRFRDAQFAVQNYSRDYGIIANLECTIFESAWYLVGLEKLLTDLLMNASYLDPLLDRIMDINLEIGKELIQSGADIIWAGDDFGGQHGIIMSPEIWRLHFKPRIKYIFEEFREVKSDIKIAWHSCGSILPIIPDFIEIGLDILNPIQPLAKDMDPAYLKSEFGKDLIFFGGIDTQELLPSGSPQQIRDDVYRKIDILGENGGFIIAPAHNIQDDTPVENVLAFFEAVQTYPD